CQPDNQNIEFSGSDQIQTPQYLDVNPPSQEISNEEIFQAKGDLMTSIQTFLESFNCIPVEEKPQILFQTWETFFAIQCSQPKDSNELFQKLLKDLKELAEYDQSTSMDRSIFLNDNEDHPRESPENSSEENVVSKTNQEPPQDSNIHQLILVKICHHKQFLFMHDNVDDLIESALDSKLLSINSINSQRLDKKEEVKMVGEQPAECENHIEYIEASLLDLEIVSIEEENGVEEENLFSITRLISNIESLNDNSTPDRVFNSFESDNSLLDNFSPKFETFCDHSEKMRSGNTTHANYSLPEYDSFRFKIQPDQERLINLVENDNSDNSSNDPLLEEADLFLSDDSIPPGFENIADDPEGDIRFLEELLIDDSILSHESFDSSFKDSLLISRPPPEPPDDNFDLEPEVISAVMEDIDEPDEHFNPGGEIFVSTNIEDVDYFLFMFVIQIFLPYLILPEISPLFLFAESEDTIFDPGISD
nr:hypothetical protein [Tanacetum cinerariifolium]